MYFNEYGMYVCIYVGDSDLIIPRVEIQFCFRNGVEVSTSTFNLENRITFIVVGAL